MARAPKYKQIPTLQQRLQKGQWWSVKKENGVPIRLMRWDGERITPTCSVSLRLSENAKSCTQKALWEAALTLETLSIERTELVSLLTLRGEIEATGKTFADWLRVIQTANDERDRALATVAQQGRDLERLQREASMSEQEITHLRGELELAADLREKLETSESHLKFSKEQLGLKDKEIQQLTQDLASARAEIAAHVHQRKAGWLIGVVTVIGAVLATLGITGHLGGSGR